MPQFEMLLLNKRINLATCANLNKKAVFQVAEGILLRQNSVKVGLDRPVVC